VTLPAEVIAGALRLMLITDRGLMGKRPAAAVRRALPRPARPDVWVMLREHDLDDDALAAAAATLDRQASVVIAGRLEVAIEVDATGVHLPEREPDLAGARARWEAACGRRHGPVIGASRHSAEGALEAAIAGAHLVQLGPIWATPSKAGMGKPLGLDALTAARAALPPEVVLVAVGGIDGPARAEAAAAAGADAVACIRAVWTAAEPAQLVDEVVAAVRRGRATRGAQP
jgi:thiamine-phosphate diphosphorylase